MRDPKIEEDDDHRPQEISDHIRETKIVYFILIDVWTVNLAAYLCENEENCKQNEIGTPDGTCFEHSVVTEE